MDENLTKLIKIFNNVLDYYYQHINVREESDISRDLIFNNLGLNYINTLKKYGLEPTKDEKVISFTYISEDRLKYIVDFYIDDYNKSQDTVIKMYIEYSDGMGKIKIFDMTPHKIIESDTYDTFKDNKNKKDVNLNSNLSSLESKKEDKSKETNIDILSQRDFYNIKKLIDVKLKDRLFLLSGKKEIEIDNEYIKYFNNFINMLNKELFIKKEDDEFIYYNYTYNSNIIFIKINKLNKTISSYMSIKNENSIVKISKEKIKHTSSDLPEYIIQLSNSMVRNTEEYHLNLKNKEKRKEVSKTMSKVFPTKF